MNVLKDAGADSAAPKTQPVTGFAGQEFQLVCAHRRQGGDAQPVQIAFIIKSAGITKVARQPQPGRELHAVSIGKRWKGGAGGSIFTVVRSLQIYAGANADRLRKPVFVCLYAFSFKIKALPRL